MKKRILFSLLVLILSGAAYGAYVFVPLLQWWYQDSYTFEEVNDKILTFQKKVVEEIEQEISNNTTSLENGFTRSWSFNMDLWVDSQFGSWALAMEVPEYSLSMQWENFDFSFKDMLMKLDISSMMLNEESGINIPDMHAISNMEGLFMKMSAINIDSEKSNILSQIPQEYIDTLNKVWKTGKYLEMTKDDSVNNAMKQVSVWNESLEFLDALLEFSKKEALLEVYKQEGTKYYLWHSKALCKLAKWSTLDNHKDKPKGTHYILEWWEISYEPLAQHYLIYSLDVEKSEEYEDCTPEEYDIFVNEAMWQNLPVNSSKSKIDIYVELSKAKTRIVSDLTNKQTIIWGEILIWLTDIISMKFKTNFLSESITWSWVLLEKTWDILSWYIDINDENSWSNIDISMNPWEEKNTYIIWAYTLKQDRSPSITGTVNWEINSGNIKTKLLTNISTWDLRGAWEFSSKNTIDIAVNFADKSYTWDIDVVSIVSLGWMPEEITSSGNMSWEYTKLEQWNKSSVNLWVDIADMWSLKYNLDYREEISQALTVDFAKPEKIYPYKVFESLLKINKKKIEKQMQEESEKELKTQQEQDKQIDVNSEARLKISSMTDKELEQMASDMEVKWSENIAQKAFYTEPGSEWIYIGDPRTQNPDERERFRRQNGGTMTVNWIEVNSDNIYVNTWKSILE